MSHNKKESNNHPLLAKRSKPSPSAPLFDEMAQFEAEEINDAPIDNKEFEDFSNNEYSEKANGEDDRDEQERHVATRRAHDKARWRIVGIDVVREVVSRTARGRLRPPRRRAHPLRREPIGPLDPIRVSHLVRTISSYE